MYKTISKFMKWSSDPDPRKGLRSDPSNLIRQIEITAKELIVREEYVGRMKRIVDFGFIIDVMCVPCLLENSEIPEKKIKALKQLKSGKKLKVRILSKGADNMGRVSINLSLIDVSQEGIY